jgi:hypothetical protein
MFQLQYQAISLILCFREVSLAKMISLKEYESKENRLGVRKSRFCDWFFVGSLLIVMFTLIHAE